MNKFKNKEFFMGYRAYRDLHYANEDIELTLLSNG